MHCQLPFRVCGGFHLDYPSPHQHIALGKTHILLLLPSVICPLLMGTTYRHSGWEPWVLFNLISVLHLPRVVLQATADGLPGPVTPGTEPHFCCCPCLTGLVFPSLALSSRCLPNQHSAASFLQKPSSSIVRETMLVTPQ